MMNTMTAKERENARAIVEEMVANGYHLMDHDIEWFVQFGEAELKRWRDRFFMVKGLS